MKTTGAFYKTGHWREAGEEVQYGASADRINRRVRLYFRSPDGKRTLRFEMTPDEARRLAESMSSMAAIIEGLDS
ncbi:hypothetical protein DF152_17345 [Burkholderia cenocepacia]|nr:hypothetical protein DF152_17345 [Burkholderia cenocepacia]